MVCVGCQPMYEDDGCRTRTVIVWDPPTAFATLHRHRTTWPMGLYANEPEE